MTAFYNSFKTSFKNRKLYREKLLNSITEERLKNMGPLAWARALAIKKDMENMLRKEDEAPDE